MHACMHACMHTCMHAYIHTYMHIYMYMYTWGLLAVRAAMNPADTLVCLRALRGRMRKSPSIYCLFATVVCN